MCRSVEVHRFEWEVIANNMANVDTVGFKRQLAIFQARNAEAIDRWKRRTWPMVKKTLRGWVPTSSS